MLYPTETILALHRAIMIERITGRKVAVRRGAKAAQAAQRKSAEASAVAGPIGLVTVTR